MIFNFMLISFFSFFSPPHDIAMAIFEINLVDQTAHFKIKIDKGDIDGVLQISTLEKGRSEKIATYLSKNTICLINNQPLDFKFNLIKNNGDFYFLESSPISFNTPFSTIDLYNTCLIETVENHSNVIYLKQKDKKMRGFRMNKDRTQISIDL